MTARPLFLGGRHIVEIEVPPEPVPFRPLTSTEGLEEIDTGRWRCVPPQSTDAEERRRIAVRALRADHVRLERTKGRRLVAYLIAIAVVAVLTLAASHAHPEPWGYGWSP